MTALEQHKHFVMQQTAVCFHSSLDQVPDHNESPVNIFIVGYFSLFIQH
jgi:hypothetical protein